MADDANEAEIREIELRIENLLLAASYRDVPKEVTVTYLKELQRLRLSQYRFGSRRQGVDCADRGIFHGR